VRIFGPPDETFLNIALDNALATLTPEEERLIEARYIAQSPLLETAAALGVSTRAIEGRLARIRAKLRKQIATQLAAYLTGGGSL
jgi:RNA polymerase sigma factor (sigma-70 family)